MYLASVSHKLVNYLEVHMNDKRKKPASTMQAARAFAEAKIAYDAATKAKKAAELDFIEACAKDGVDASVIPDFNGKAVKVFVRHTIRTKFVLERLRKLVKPAVLKKMLVEELDQKKVANAVGIGLISPAIADEATDVTKVVSVMVAELETADAQ